MILGMELRLPSVIIRPVRDEIRITHVKTGMVTVVSKKQLDAWAVRQLRADLTTTKVQP